MRNIGYAGMMVGTFECFACAATNDLKIGLTGLVLGTLGALIVKFA